MNNYNFRTQYDLGKEGEAFLDEYFSEQGFEIEMVGMDMEKIGVDRLFHKTGCIYKVEYKTDFQTTTTGNVFLELDFNDGKRKGWVKTTQADFVVYFAPTRTRTRSRIYIFRPEILREALPTLEVTLPKRSVFNDYGNKTVVAHGLLLPHKKACELASKVIYL